MYDSLIQRFASGTINQVNDSLAGGGGGNIGPQVGLAPGQLGNGIWLDDSNVIFAASVGTVFGGHFRYVRLSASAGTPVVGQTVYWDVVANAVDNLFQVTTSEAGTTDTAMNGAGIILSTGVTPGNYTVIQDVGPTFCKFRGTLTAAGAIGSRCFEAAAGGADTGFLDVIDSSNPTLFSDVSKMLGRYVGIAIDAPTNGGLKRVYVNFHNVRG
jgi:hypothetical protein